MRSLLRRIGLGAAVIFSLFAFSCEQHHVGELPPEKPMANPGHPPPPPPAHGQNVSPTPADFFPTGTPR